MLVIILSVFALCWLPFQISILYSEYRPDKEQLVRGTGREKVEKGGRDSSCTNGWSGLSVHGELEGRGSFPQRFYTVIVSVSVFCQKTFQRV